MTPEQDQAFAIINHAAARLNRRPKRRSGPKIINGVRWVRIRNDYPDIGPFRIHMFIVTDLDSRKRLGIRHLSYEAASRWVTEQGWRHLGTQVP